MKASLIKNILHCYCFLMLSGCTPNSFSSDPLPSVVDTSVEEIKEEKTLDNLLSNEILLKQYNCPHYHCKDFTVKIFQEKMMIQYQSADSIAVKRDLKFTLGVKESLKTIINNLKLGRMKTEVIPGKSNCQNFATDYPSYQLVLYKGEFVQSLDIYAGCQDLPQSYQDLINWIKNYSPNKSRQSES